MVAPHLPSAPVRVVAPRRRNATPTAIGEDPAEGVLNSLVTAQRDSLASVDVLVADTCQTGSPAADDALQALHLPVEGHWNLPGGGRETCPVA